MGYFSQNLVEMHDGQSKLNRNIVCSKTDKFICVYSDSEKFRVSCRKQIYQNISLRKKRKFHYSSQHLDYIYLFKTDLERNQDPQEKCLIPGLRYRKYMNIKYLFLCCKVKGYSKNDGDITKGYRSQPEQVVTGQIREILRIKQTARKRFNRHKTEEWEIFWVCHSQKGEANAAFVLN